MPFTQIALNVKAEPARVSKDSSGYTYSSNQIGLSSFIPVYTKRYYNDRNAAFNSLGFFTSPNFRLNNVKINYLPNSRILINAGLGVGGFYHFKQKHTITAIFNSLFNEDEFTINYPVLSYSGLLLYAYKNSDRFTYYLGGAYSYLYGGADFNGLFLPVAGARFSIGDRSRFIIILPFNMSYHYQMNKKTRLSFNVKPNGGINRIENRGYFYSNDEVVMLRRRSFVLSAGLLYHVANNLSITTNLGIAAARKLFLTDQSISQIFVANEDNGFQLDIKLIWRPWQNNLRNKEKLSKEKQTDYPDEIDNSDILGF